MSPANDDREDMRPEYDIRGGVRGKYAEQYSISITFEDSSFIATTTVNTPWVGGIIIAAVYPPAYPSPKIELGASVPALVPQ